MRHQLIEGQRVLLIEKDQNFQPHKACQSIRRKLNCWDLVIRNSYRQSFSRFVSSAYQKLPRRWALLYQPSQWKRNQRCTSCLAMQFAHRLQILLSFMIYKCQVLEKVYLNAPDKCTLIYYFSNCRACRKKEASGRDKQVWNDLIVSSRES